jgi:phage-related protein
MLDLQLASILEKNKISNTTAFIVLLEIIIPGIAEHIRVCYNNADIIWNSYTWLAFPFELGEVTEDRSELPSINLKVSNVNKVVSGYLEQTSGGAGSTVIIRVVNSANLEATEPDLEETFAVQGVTVDISYATFRLGADTAATLRRPFGIYQGRHCRNKFKDVKCGYNGAATVCDKTLARCKELNNSVRWNAEYGITGKFYKSS